MSAQDIKSALADRAGEFVHFLFPAGQRDGNEWKVGSLRGEKGRSLTICIVGSKAGMFCDFATNERGNNLVEVYRQARGVDFKTALHACAEWLGTSVIVTPAAAPRVAEQHSQRALWPADIYNPTDAECAAAGDAQITLTNLNQ